MVGCGVHCGGAHLRALLSGRALPERAHECTYVLGLLGKLEFFFFFFF